MKSLINSALFVLTFMILTPVFLQGQQGLFAIYYDGPNLEDFVAGTYYDKIDTSWNEEPPYWSLDPHNFSIRWMARLLPDQTGEYLITTRVDDGIRVWIGGQIIIDQWELNDIGIFEGKVDLVANVEYEITVEYFNALNEGEVRLLWTLPSDDLPWYDFWNAPNPQVIAPQYFMLPKKPSNLEDGVVDKTDEEQSKPLESKSQTSTIRKIKTLPLSDNSAKGQPIDTHQAEKFVPKNIDFEKGNTTILNSSFGELDVFADFMLNNPKVTVKIEGHTAPNGDKQMNLKLSKERAFMVAKYIVNLGVDPSRISTVGLGGSQPLVGSKDGSIQLESRRVMFILSGLE